MADLLAQLNELGDRLDDLAPTIDGHELEDRVRGSTLRPSPTRRRPRPVVIVTASALIALTLVGGGLLAVDVLRSNDSQPAEPATSIGPVTTSTTTATSSAAPTTVEASPSTVPTTIARSLPPQTSAATTVIPTTQPPSTAIRTSPDGGECEEAPCNYGLDAGTIVARWSGSEWSVDLPERLSAGRKTLTYERSDPDTSTTALVLIGFDFHGQWSDFVALADSGGLDLEAALSNDDVASALEQLPYWVVFIDAIELDCPCGQGGVGASFRTATWNLPAGNYVAFLSTSQRMLPATDDGSVAVFSVAPASSGPAKLCPQPTSIPEQHDLEEWVVTIRDQVATLATDVNTMMRAVVSVHPSDSGWAETGPVSATVEVVLEDVGTIKRSSREIMEAAGMVFGRSGLVSWPEDLKGPIFWLPEGVWSQARFLEQEGIDEFLSSPTTASALDFYNQGGIAAGVCGTVTFMIDAVNGIIEDSLGQ